MGLTAFVFAGMAYEFLLRLVACFMVAYDGGFGI